MKSCVVAIIDPTRRNGGLGDRLRHIVSVYSFCKKADLPFKLHFTDPVDIQNFLIPNKYDWRIKSEEISHSYFNTIVIFLLSGYKNKGIDYNTETSWQWNRLLKAAGNRFKQIHVFGNAHLTPDSTFPKLFQELFKPSIKLQTRLDSLKSEIGAKYSAAVFRFQNLLGDLKERGSHELNDDDKKRLKLKCMSKLREMHESGQFKNSTILVTSDSVAFLEYVQQLKFVKIIPGEIAHLDYNKTAAVDTYMKSYIDLIMLSKAGEIILFQTENMYESGFPRIAAQIGDKPFSILKW